ncbi:hypothetical protein ACFVUR_09580 [Stenotrophomonas bentonitica]|uniref:hypothetical protein n=1 Tax=Stenotrophomonas bentonitica TaxID=1450134 RepID=UPI0036EADB22
MSNANYPVCQLTKRELIAAMALQGMNLGPHSYSQGDREREKPQIDANRAAADAVRVADALIAELERTA